MFPDNSKDKDKDKCTHREGDNLYDGKNHWRDGGESTLVTLHHHKKSSN
jgi:hypothetical protein